MAAPDLRVRKVQVALFCRINLNDKLTFAAELRRRNQEWFDGEPVMFPNVASGRAAFSLHSRDGNRTLTASSRRVDVTAQYPAEPSPVITDAVDNETGLIRDLVATLQDMEQVEGNIDRMGILLSLGTDVDDSAVDEVRNIFLAPRVGLGQRRSEVMFLDTVTWEGFEVNRRMMLAVSPRFGATPPSLELTTVYSAAPGGTDGITRPWVDSFLDQLKAKCAEELEVLNA